MLDVLQLGLFFVKIKEKDHTYRKNHKLYFRVVSIQHVVKIEKYGDTIKIVHALDNK